MTALYVEQSRPMIFTDEAIPAGIGPASRLLLKFGLFFFDYDLDGWQDLLTANGHLEEEISQIQKSQHYEQPAQLFWNSGPEYGCQFLEVSAEHSGEALFRPIVGRGSAFADIDNDGDLDFVVTQINGSPRLFRNDQALGHHWIRIRLRGNTQNRDGVGAWIKVTVGGRVLWRQVMPTRSYLSQSELPVTVGIGDASGVDALEIVWPGGKVQSVENVVIDQVTTVTEE
ncbi:MAG: CRTAC1 family protein [Verrucomicrobia bacterium]|nr:CRTAC1 family protein [Verrucomicrobiota bacterium]